MNTISNIRVTQPEDLVALEALYPLAFPEENLLPVLRALHAGKSDVLSLVYFDEEIVGHVAFSECGTPEYPNKFSLLAPLAVSPSKQKQGIGSELARHGLQILSEKGVMKAFVLGDPNYYGRFGFEPEPGVLPPYELPTEWAAAWQSMALSDTAVNAHGKLMVSEPWQDPALWAE